MRDRIREIQQQEFLNSIHKPSVDFGAIKVGLQQLDDATLVLNDYKRANRNLGDKEYVLKAITDGDVIRMREISDFYFKVSGIYGRILRYMAYMYKYDWFVTPYIKDRKMKQDDITDRFTKVLDTLDNTGIKKLLGEIALKVLRKGAYYGYKIERKDGSYILQELPINYCRRRYKYGTIDAVEFNMKYFDDQFSTVELRNRILGMFPKEFKKGYDLFKKGKLKPDFPGDTNGWYLLDPNMTARFTLNDEEYPPFISVIPLLLDLDEAQGLNKKKLLQRILKIIVQKMPIDKNGDLIFDPDEAQQLHNNAVAMLQNAIGTKVFTTFADVDVVSFAENTSSTASSDDLKTVEQQVYSEAGISYLQFNSDSSAALDRSIANDASTMYNLILQFEEFLNGLLINFNKNKKKIIFKVQILGTTIYNYQEVAKLYKEQMQLGFSKMLPAVALGQSQSSILSNAYFENDILDLVNVFIPPLMSSVMNGDTMEKLSTSGGGKEGAGRPTNEEKGEMPSEKTIANQESQ